jgi:hypothetical protein
VDNNITISDEKGRFTITKPNNIDSVTVSFVGYQSKKIALFDMEDLKVLLEQDATFLQPFILKNYEMYHNISSKTGRISINPRQVSSLPNLGQIDVFKSIQLMPGISATDESNGGLQIRGSSSGQNLVLFDGFTIYHLDHFFGIYSTFNSSTINNVNVYKGGFGAEYGGRISSVIEVTGKHGSTDQFHGSLSMDMLSINAHVEFPISKKLSLIAGARSSYFELAGNSIFEDFVQSNRVDLIESNQFVVEEDPLEITPSASFYDFYTKIRFAPSINETLDLNVFFSEDTYNGNIIDEQPDYITEINDDANWGNFGLSFLWEKYYKNNWSNKLVAGYSAYKNSSSYEVEEIINEIDSVNDFNFDFDTTFFSNYVKNNSIEDFTFKYFVNKAFSEQLNTHIGFEFNAITSSNELTYFDEIEDDFKDTGNQFAFIFNNNLNLNKLNASIGARIQTFSNTDFLALEPRLSARYQLRKDFFFKGSYSLHHQFIHQLLLTPFGNSDQFYWVISDGEEYPIQKSHHYIFGAEYAYKKFGFDIEFYQKNNTGVLFNDFVYYSLEPIEFIESYEGSNTNTGMDLLIKYQEKKYESWLSYSLSKSINAFPILNDGAVYYSNLDQRHELSFTNILKMEKWEFSSGFISGSARPYTPPRALASDELYNFVEINKERLPSYHRLDLSAKYNFTFKQFEGFVGLSLFNVYNKRNVRSRRFAYELDLVDDFEEIVSDPDFDPNDEDELFDVSVAPIDVLLLGFTPNLSLNIRF